MCVFHVITGRAHKMPIMQISCPCQSAIIWMSMMTSPNRNPFRVTGPCAGIFPHKCQWLGALVFFYLRLNKRLSRQSWGWWFQTSLCSLWRHFNVPVINWREFLRILLICFHWLFVQHQNDYSSPGNLLITEPFVDCWSCVIMECKNYECCMISCGTTSRC